MEKEALTYRFLSTKDILEVSELITHVFNQFVALDYSNEGVQEFYRYIQPSAFRNRTQPQHFSLIALKQNKIVGVIEMREHHHISLLFVAPDVQRRGIAKELLHQALQICRTHEPRLLDISVNASSYAVPIYERLGFRCNGEKQIRNGIGFFPMVLTLPGQGDSQHYGGATNSHS